NNLRRIGLVIPEIADPLDYELVQGIYDQAAALGMDVIIYAGVLNPMPDSRRDYYTEGFENIYALVCRHRLDGILFAANRFHDDQLRQKIYALFAQTVTPVLTLDFEAEGQACLIAEQHDGAYAMTKHLIEDHGCRKLWCIAGFKDHAPSMERLRGFTDAMHDAGLPIGEDAIHFGNYWRDIPEQLARDILGGKYECPDGVVALSDSMAIYFGDTLRRGGIAVPQQVKVTGYDGMWYSAMHDPITTTVCGREKQLGEAAVCRLYEMMTGQQAQPLGSRQTIRYGTSCGCGYDKVGQQIGLLQGLQQQVAKQLFRGFEKRSFLSADFISRMADAEALEHLTGIIDENAYLLRGWNRMDIALCSDWCPDFENPYSFRQQGFSDTMQLALSKRQDASEMTPKAFRTEAILPSLQEAHEPELLVLTSLHCKGQILGYCALAFDAPDGIELDDYFVSWTDAVSNGLYSLQKRLYIQYLHEQMESLSTRDAITELFNKHGFLEQLPDTLHRLRKAETAYSLFWISWMERTSPEAYDMAVLLGNALKRADLPLCARLGKKVFAAVLPETADAEHFPERLHEELSGGIGASALPELITQLTPIPGKKPSELEHAVEALYADFLQKCELEISRGAAYREQIYKLRRDIMAHPEREWSITAISRGLGISKTHLQRLYKELFATGIKDDLITSRMNRAMQLLTHTDLRVQEIAERCGYNNENHFMRQFKEKNGMTALQYRKQFPN
ncbi:MAG: substrate-binding domain-containing protein, partial [Oscillospiraceae bacterium]|nr:substrate-binding domain-containing protein [Oscillospiraceae bacterium]